MSEYEVLFKVKLSAKDKQDLYSKAEEISDKFSEVLHKKVLAHGYVNLENTVQMKLL